MQKEEREQRPRVAKLEGAGDGGILRTGLSPGTECSSGFLGPHRHGNRNRGG